MPPKHAGVLSKHAGGASRHAAGTLQTLQTRCANFENTARSLKSGSGYQNEGMQKCARISKKNDPTCMAVRVPPDRTGERGKLTLVAEAKAIPGHLSQLDNFILSPASHTGNRLCHPNVIEQNAVHPLSLLRSVRMQASPCLDITQVIKNPHHEDTWVTFCKMENTIIHKKSNKQEFIKHSKTIPQDSADYRSLKAIKHQF